nr:MAG TPA: hypothetical protein [Caudoviricetes sp.]
MLFGIFPSFIKSDRHSVVISVPFRLIFNLLVMGFLTIKFSDILEFISLFLMKETITRNKPYTQGIRIRD